MLMNKNEPILADDSNEKVSLLLKLRLPWLIAGLLLGTVLTVAVSKFESLLSRDVALAFFIPIIVYISDAVGTQTQTIYIRNLAKGHAKFSTYMVKEIILGIILGGLFGSAMGTFAWLWRGSIELGLTVGLAMAASVATATVVALLIPIFLKAEHTDPAVGGGPVTTVIQDLISVLIYFAVASVIIL